MLILLLQTVLVYADVNNDNNEGIDEEISLKKKLFGTERYDKDAIQNRWRRTVESDIENIGWLLRVCLSNQKLHASSQAHVNPTM